MDNNLNIFIQYMANELNATDLGKKYLFKNQGNGEIWVGKWGGHGISYTEFIAKITRNHTDASESL